MNTLDLANKKTNLKKVASTHGGEWAGPCPECGGNDRFRVWPNENAGKGGYWCRSCGKAGDNIQFLIDFEMMSFKDACAYLNIQKPNRDQNYTPPPRREFTPSEHKDPEALWQEKAEKFTAWAQDHLMRDQRQLDWLAARGIDRAAAQDARLGWNPGENDKDLFRARVAWGLPEKIKENGKPRMLWLPRGLVVPCISGGIVQRLRIRRPEEHRDPENKLPYYLVPGSSMRTMIIGVDRKAFIIVESELDGIACASATNMAGACAVGTLSGKPDVEAYSILSGAEQILDALDYGEEGGAKAPGIRARNWWREEFGKRYTRWPVTKGKDPGEAVREGIDLKKWIEAGVAPTIKVAVMGDRYKTAVKNIDSQAQASPIPVVTDTISTPPQGSSALLIELWGLLRANPAVVIINQPGRFAILRNGRPVGGRIQELILREKDVTDYVMAHKSEAITWNNLFA